jgi:voltage-gated potassium channel
MGRISQFVLLLLFLTAVGVVGFKLIDEDASWITCFYMTVITLSTVGYREAITIRDNDAAQLFVSIYLVFGLGVFTYSAFQLGQWIVTANMNRRSILEKRRMQREITQYHDHFIVCGHGRMGDSICGYLTERKMPFVVIDVDESRLQQSCSERGWHYVVGDATDDDVLQRAGIARARSLASVLPTDADNVYVVLSARLLNADLQIVARASDEKAIEKMSRAGATRIVSPFSSGAEKMARFMLNPSVEDFLDVADSHGNELELADVQIDEESPYVGKQLMDTDLRENGVMIIGIRRSNGERLMPPPGTAVIHPGDSLFVFGSTSAVNAMIGEGEHGETSS